MGKNKSRFKITRNDVAGWLVMLAPVVLFAFFVWEPLIENVNLSLHSAQGFTIKEFVGFDNYRKVFDNPVFLQALKNTFIYLFWSMVIGFVVPIIMGILISETIHMKGFFRTTVYFPNIVPGLATVWIWSYFFNPGSTGVLNIFLSALGIDPQPWLTDPKMTIPLIIVSMTWKGAGSTALIYMANISSINPELYEAAATDGATFWHRIRHITLPSLGGIIKTMLILQIISVFQVLYEPMVMTNGGPNNASISIMMLMYQYAFRDFDYPAAAALSVIICIILIILSGIYMKLSNPKSDKKTGKRGA